MTPTIPYIEDKVRTYNARYFDNSLPPIPVKLSNAKGFLGKLTYRTRRTLFGAQRHYDFTLRINTRIDMDEALIEDTIIHELIHYYIAYHDVRDTSTHGVRFREMMQRINHLDNRHITISHRLTPEQEQQAAGRKRERVVAIVHFADGRLGLKVVPPQADRLAAWEAETKRHFPIDYIAWYITDDGYFAKYPSSYAFRIYLVPKFEDLPLASAQRIHLSCLCS